MGCPRCGKNWLKVEGNQLICSCGYVETVKMPDPADLIEQAELDIWGIIDKLHKAGVRYKIVHLIMTELVKTLEIQGYAEEWLKQPSPDSIANHHD